MKLKVQFKKKLTNFLSFSFLVLCFCQSYSNNLLAIIPYIKLNGSTKHWKKLLLLLILKEQTGHTLMCASGGFWPTCMIMRWTIPIHPTELKYIWLMFLFIYLHLMYTIGGDFLLVGVANFSQIVEIPGKFSEIFWDFGWMSVTDFWPWIIIFCYKLGLFPTGLNGSIRKRKRKKRKVWIQ